MSTLMGPFKIVYTVIITTFSVLIRLEWVEVSFQDLSMLVFNLNDSISRLGYVLG